MTRSVEIPEEALKAARLAVRAMDLSHDGTSFPISHNEADEAAELALEAALPYLAPAEPTRPEDEVKAEALREAAEAFAFFTNDAAKNAVVDAWLCRRADELEAGR